MTSSDNIFSLLDIAFSVTAPIFIIISLGAWLNHIKSILHNIDTQSSKGFAFNCLTKYSDADKIMPHLYYADPAEIFHFCKQNYSRNVALLHDYDLYEFTILVRK